MPKDNCKNGIVWRINTSEEHHFVELIYNLIMFSTEISDSNDFKLKNDSVTRVNFNRQKFFIDSIENIIKGEDSTEGTFTGLNFELFWHFLRVNEDYIPVSCINTIFLDFKSLDDTQVSLVQEYFYLLL